MNTGQQNGNTKMGTNTYIKIKTPKERVFNRIFFMGTSFLFSIKKTNSFYDEVISNPKKISRQYHFSLIQINK